MSEGIYGINPIYPEIAIKRPTNPETCAREIFKMSPEWQTVGWERKNFDTMAEYLLVKGAIYKSVYLRGKRKGKTNFKKPEPGTYCELPVTEAVLEEWLVRWELETGLCRHCKGSGWQWAGWRRDKGTKHRPCKCSLGQALSESEATE